MGSVRRTPLLRHGALLLITLAALSGCELNDRVDARMRTPEVTDRFEETDEPGSAADDPDSTTSTTEARDVSLDGVGGTVGDVGERNLDATHRGTGFWELDVETPGGIVHIKADLDFDLIPLSPEELVEFGVVEAGEENLFRRDRWYSVVGTINHDLLESGCTPSPDFDDCQLALATDGSVVGLASIIDGQADVTLDWRLVGRGAQQATPRLSVRTVNEGGFRSTVELLDLAASLETRVIGRSVKVDVDGGSRVVQSFGGSGAGEIRVDTLD